MWRFLDVTFEDHGFEGGVGQPCPTTVHTPPHRWHYGSLSSEPRLRGDSGLVAVKIAAVIHDGPIGIGLVSPQNISCFVVPEQILDSSPHPQEVTFLVPADKRFRVCVRTGDADHSGHVQIEGVSWTANHKVIKEIQVADFVHWHYTTDLGDGVIVRATVQDEPGWTRANETSRAIFSHLLKEYVGPISGRKVLDVACSAGHFSFLFARMGAEVDGFDHDSKAIEQAQFIAKQLHQGWAGSAKFVVADLESFATDEQYDVVFCSGLFYHLRDPIKGAQRLEQLTRQWLVLQSCVSDRQEPVFELSDPTRWPFCAEWEFCLVPSAPMVRAIFEKLKLEVRASFRLSDFVVDGNAPLVKIRSASRVDGERVARLGDPIYLVLEKVV
ncbi:MAG: class I SAM-dependent methyltransferase [Acidobacteria bacterium]|nr:class I SAM-dependent methyltransferase [Acidobacteriota bacterium]